MIIFSEFTENDLVSIWGTAQGALDFTRERNMASFCMKSGRKSIKTQSERVKTWVPPTKICIVPWGTMINFYIDQRGGTPWPDKLHSPELGRTCRNYSTLPPGGPIKSNII